MTLQRAKMAIGWKRNRQVPEVRVLSLNARTNEAPEFRVLKAEVTIGSGEDNQFVIRRSSVSRCHASLAFRKDGYEISDLDSTNGTFVNGQPVRSATIVEVGDEIRIGDAVFILAKPAGAAVLPSGGTRGIPKRILTSRGAFEAVLIAFAIGFGAAQYLAYLFYHEQNRLILAEAVPVNQPAKLSPAAVAPKQPGTQVTPSKNDNRPATSEIEIEPRPSKIHVSDTNAAKEFAGGIALTRLVAGSGTAAGRAAPDFGLVALNGENVTLGSMHGKVVLVNFWATWCGSCRSEMPALESFYRQFKSYPDFAVLTVSVDEGGKPAVTQFMARNGYDFPVLLDGSNMTSSAYGVSGIPSTFVIGRDGRIIWNCVGALDWSNPVISEALKKIL